MPRMSVALTMLAACLATAAAAAADAAGAASASTRPDPGARLEPTTAQLPDNPVHSSRRPGSARADADAGYERAGGDAVPPAQPPMLLLAQASPEAQSAAMAGLTPPVH
jgi:hypothetical protein